MVIVIRHMVCALRQVMVPLVLVAVCQGTRVTIVKHLQHLQQQRRVVEVSGRWRTV